MFQAKDLTDEQVAALKKWAAEGAQLADLQRKLKEDFDLNVTYMDMRFVVLDMQLELETPDEDEGEAQEEEAAEPIVGTGQVSVSVDQVTRPGAMVSGKVTFSDGERGEWMIDSMGRPSLDPETPGYQPTQDDLMDFQKGLQAELEGAGGLGL